MWIFLDLLISIQMHLVFGFGSFIVSILYNVVSKPSILFPVIVNMVFLFLSGLPCVLFPIIKIDAKFLTNEDNIFYYTK